MTYTFPFLVRDDLCISPEKLDSDYFFGVNIVDQLNRGISSKTKERYIKKAQDEIEKFLQVKLFPQIIEEEIDFIREEYENWVYIRTSYPVKKAFSLEGYISDVMQIKYPTEWIKAKKGNDELVYERQLHLVPGGDTTIQTSSVIFSGVSPHLGFFGYRQIPDYWKVTYCTGFTKVPGDILSAIGYLASIPLFAIAGDLIIGAGIASQSLGIDGLSQSISTTSSATNAGYGARIQEYRQALKTLLPNLKANYKGITFSAQ